MRSGGTGGNLIPHLTVGSKQSKMINHEAII